MKRRHSDLDLEGDEDEDDYCAHGLDLNLFQLNGLDTRD